MVVSSLRNNKNELPLYIPRSTSKPFQTLKSDEKVFANIALAYKDLIKYYYDVLFDCDFDDISVDEQLYGKSSDKKGGIDYFNYMYSESYKDDEGLKKDKIKVGGKDPNFWAALSVSDALERFSCASFGDFVVPTDILDYVKECRKNGRLKDRDVTFSIKQYEDAYKKAQLLATINPKLPSMTIVGMIGSFAHECAWIFNDVVNMHEYNNKGGTSSYAAGENAGEGWFGVTGVAVKKRCCAAVGVPYSFGAIAKFSDAQWAKLIKFWLTELIPKEKSKAMLNEPKTDEDRRKLIWSCWLYKAAPGVGLNWESIKSKIQDYWSTHTKQNKGDESKVKDSFAGMVYMAIMFSLYCKDTSKVPKLPF